MKISTVKKILTVGIVLLIGIIGIKEKAYAAESSSLNMKIGVLPFSPLGVNEDDAERLAEMIGKKLSFKMFVENHDNVMDELDDEDCDDEEDWDDRECIQKVGEELEAEYILAGSIGKVGALFVADVALFNIPKRISAWSQQYRSEGSMDNALLSIPQKVADDVIRALSPSDQGVAETVYSPEKYTPSNQKKYTPPSPEKLSKADNGIAKGPVIGVRGLFAVGREIKNTQSPVGFHGMFLYPTSKNSHVRAKVGVPLWHNSNNRKTEGKETADIQICAEHEWGWPNVGLTAGLAYTILTAYDNERTVINSLGSSTYIYEHDAFHSFNFVFGVRGGRPNGAFYGNISFPLAITLEESRGNYIFAYNVFGVFGARNTKVGIGHMATFKRRETDKLKIDGITQEVSNSGESGLNLSNPTEFHYLFPCLKVAHLFAEKIVVCGILELGGLIIPRFGNYDWWKPSLGFDFVYSFGKLDGANVMDGTF